MLSLSLNANSHLCKTEKFSVFNNYLITVTSKGRLVRVKDRIAFFFFI